MYPNFLNIYVQVTQCRYHEAFQIFCFHKSYPKLFCLLQNIYQTVFLSQNICKSGLLLTKHVQKCVVSDKTCSFHVLFLIEHFQLIFISQRIHLICWIQDMVCELIITSGKHRESGTLWFPHSHVISVQKQYF